MVYDGFIFFNEIELLELRLKTMYDYVDKFILVESKYTFTNEPKELFYETNKEKFKRYWDKIEHIVVEMFPVTCATAWEREFFQRNEIQRGIKDADADDILIISDLDEIISPYGVKRVTKILKKFPDRVLNLELLNCWYYLNYVDQKVFFLAAPRACTIENFNKIHSEWKCSITLTNDRRLTPQVLRAWEKFEIIQCAGWHFSYIGGMERIIKKIQSFSHQEFNNEDILNEERIKRAIESGRDLFDREISDFASISIGALMPNEIRKNRKKYEKWLCDFKPMSFKNQCRLVIKYLVETTWLRKIYHLIKR